MSRDEVDWTVKHLARIADALEEIASALKKKPVAIGRTVGFDGQPGIVVKDIQYGAMCTCGNPTTTTGGCPVHGIGPL